MPPLRLLGLPSAGGDLHYHLSQHGVFSEADMRFYAAEIILGLEHMHNRFVVYRDLKVRLRPPPRPCSTAGTGPAGTGQPAAPFHLRCRAIFRIQVVTGGEGEGLAQGLIPGHPDPSRVT